MSWKYDYFPTDICTLRLDFETFTTRGTSGTGGTDLTDGMCTDTFVVTVKGEPSRKGNLQACARSQKISVQFNFAFKNIWRSVRVHVQKFGGQKFEIAFTFIFLLHHKWVGAEIFLRS